VVADEIAYHDEVNNEVKIVLEDVNAIELKDVNTAVSDDEREIQSDSVNNTIENDEDEEEIDSQSNLIINLGKI
jgi:hypothetical protein